MAEFRQTSRGQGGRIGELDGEEKGRRHTFVLAPETIRRRKVVDTRQVLEVIRRDLSRWDAQLLLQLSRRSDTDA